jgi:hypothetical protein
MSYVSLLINTCTTQRKHPGAIDAYGTPGPGWANELVNIICRWSTPSNREIKVGAEVVIVDLILFVEDVDITVQDRVLLDMDGTVRTYEAIQILRRQDSTAAHHKEAYLRVVQ